MIITTKKLFQKAYGRYAIPAYNVNNMELARAVAEACQETKTPFIFQISRGARQYASPTLLKNIIKGIDETYPELIFAVHLDHGTLEACENIIDNESDFFTSVMIDLSHEPLEKNIEGTKLIVEKAHQKGLSVEAELGQLGGVEEDIIVSEEHACLTSVEDAKIFVEKTNCDSLAIAIGTSHGAYKFANKEPKLHLDRAKKIQESLPDNFPLVLHGASSVPEELVKEINTFGGDIKGSRGVPENYYPEAYKYGICKINIDTDLRLAWYAGMRKHLEENPDNFDFRKSFMLAMEKVKEVVKEKTKFLVL